MTVVRNASGAAAMAAVAAGILVLAGCGGTSSKAASTPLASAATPSPTGSPSALTASAAQALVSRAVLGNGDIGNGWSGGLLDGGGTLEDPTLDLCGGSYPSDKLRLARQQTVLDSRTAAVSNEVVGYQPGGAKQAIREARAAIAPCQHKVVHDGGDTYTVTLTALATHTAWGADAVAVSETDVGGGGTSQTTAVYFAHGDVLSAIYSWDGNTSKDLIFAIADLSAKRVTEAFAGQPVTTGAIPVPTGTPLDTAPSSPHAGSGSSAGGVLT